MKYRLPRGMRQAFEQAGIALIRVNHPFEAMRVGIHLLNPDRRELEQALERAERDLFPAVLIHDFGTWGHHRGYQSLTPEMRRERFGVIQGGAA